MWPQKYAKEIFINIKVEECKSITTPMNKKVMFLKQEGVEKVDKDIIGAW